MSIFKPFEDDTNLIRFENTIYKVRVLFDTGTLSSKVKETFDTVNCSSEIEDAFRALLFMELHNKDFKTIQTDYFIISAERKKWKAASKLQFSSPTGVLINHPFFLVLNIKIRNDIFVESSQESVRKMCPRATERKKPQTIVVHSKYAQKENTSDAHKEKYSFRSRTVASGSETVPKEINNSNSHLNSSETKHGREESSRQSQVANSSKSELPRIISVKKQNARQTLSSSEKSVEKTTKVTPQDPPEIKDARFNTKKISCIKEHDTSLNNSTEKIKHKRMGTRQRLYDTTEHNRSTDSHKSSDSRRVTRSKHNTKEYNKYSDSQKHKNIRHRARSKGYTTENSAEYQKNIDLSQRRNISEKIVDVERTLCNQVIDTRSLENRKKTAIGRSNSPHRKLDDPQYQPLSPKRLLQKPSSHSKRSSVERNTTGEKHDDKDVTETHKDTGENKKQVNGDESTRLLKLKCQKTPEKRHRTRAKLDRHLIEEEELDEELKLQQISGPSTNLRSSPRKCSSLKRSPRQLVSDEKFADNRKRRSSGLWEFAESLFEPLKKMWKTE